MGITNEDKKVIDEAIKSDSSFPGSTFLVALACLTEELGIKKKFKSRIVEQTLKQIEESMKTIRLCKERIKVISDRKEYIEECIKKAMDNELDAEQKKEDEDRKKYGF